MNPQEYMKTLGRDGTYKEFDVKNLKSLMDDVKSGTAFPKMIVLNNGRLELSNPTRIQQFENAVKTIGQSSEVDGMDSEQVGFYLFRKIFEKGLESFK